MLKMDRNQLRKNKEQLLTDILCAIPDSLQIDINMQKIDKNGERIKQFIRNELLGNWCKDPVTLLLFIVTIGMGLFFLVCISYGDRS